MFDLLKGLVNLVEKMLPRVSDRTANKAFRTIIVVMVRLVYLSAFMYWLIKFLGALHQFGRI